MQRPLRSTATKTVYIAGPMRGLPRCNFPAFDAAERRLRRQGLAVINPAEEDRRGGFNENTDNPTAWMVKTAFLRDISQIIWNCDAIAMLPNSKDHPKSLCHIERAIAEAFGLEVIELEDDQ